ncbi:hypothetical protein SAMN02746089_00617 [Caldanaerobius fijiensis DSM 17918]|uniref:Uncharacterized protein n=1 Tax=Caldanaerobius fijiensis DSM 17918 TaxID=1121256 RepID=A0A1M4VFP3_9THEO|nr:hypothetical protein [Caldanaerobius fijiensis]SHE67836.1 hypothetical protein SAMN02746089_00617 [Caldanaerobius fijiensis DSM 17918]
MSLEELKKSINNSNLDNTKIDEYISNSDTCTSCSNSCQGGCSAGCVNGGTNGSLSKK